MHLIAKGETPWTAGVARRVITPPPQVELAGLGYYLNRTPQRIRDNLTATALVIGDERGKSAGLLAMDLMYNDAGFTGIIRRQVAAETDIPAEAICVNFSHSHNAPTAGYARGAGEVDPGYLRFAARQASDALIEAWRRREPAHLRAGCGHLTGVSFNRTREGGPVDTNLSVLRVDTATGAPLAVAANFHCHPNAHMDLDYYAVSRDWPGELVDQIETALPGATALYLQGTCGDVMVSPEFCSTERRFEVARRAASVALRAWESSREVNGTSLATVARRVALPTRPWEREEVMQFRAEGRHRLSTGDTTGWLDGVARAVVVYPHRLPLRYGGSIEKAVAAVARFAVEWSDLTLPVLDQRSEILETELQAMRVGDIWLVANEAELFTSQGLDVRRRWPHESLFMLGYSNGTIGYLPDTHDVELRTYAAVQSPKFNGQFPFTARSGEVMVAHMLRTLGELQQSG